MNINYSLLLYSVFIIILLISVFFLMSYAFTEKKKIKTLKKKSLYECGFEALGTSSTIIHLQYINIALLFIIFDLEILFILPWVISANHLGNLGLFTIYIVLGFFIFGFFYEYFISAMDWNKKKLVLK